MKEAELQRFLGILIIQLLKTDFIGKTEFRQLQWL